MKSKNLKRKASVGTPAQFVTQGGSRKRACRLRRCVLPNADWPPSALAWGSHWSGGNRLGAVHWRQFRQQLLPEGLRCQSRTPFTASVAIFLNVRSPLLAHLATRSGNPNTARHLTTSNHSKWLTAANHPSCQTATLYSQCHPGISSRRTRKDRLVEVRSSPILYNPSHQSRSSRANRSRRRAQRGINSLLTNLGSHVYHPMTGMLFVVVSVSYIWWRAGRWKRLG